jgi:hypothetical protein
LLPTVERGDAGSEGGSDGERLLHQLPRERCDPVRRFVGELLTHCSYCDAEVRRDSPRGLDADERLGCLACVKATLGTCPLCRAEVTRQHRRTELPNGAIAHRDCAEKRRRWEGEV